MSTFATIAYLKSNGLPISGLLIEPAPEFPRSHSGVLTMNILIILIAACIPPVFLIYGKRLFGAQTHPAAIFILAWIASTFVLATALLPETPMGKASFIWVLVCSVVYEMIRKIKKQSPPGLKSGQP